MATKKCKNCGYEVDKQVRIRRCPECGTMFDENYCKKCGKLASGKDLVQGIYCRACVMSATKPAKPSVYLRCQAKKRKMNADEFAAWLEKIKCIPNSYPSLTEEQWLEACSYFGGCARCGADDISTRGYFIAGRDGGKYCDWNVIPLCETCSLTAQRQELVNIPRNPFSYYRVTSTEQAHNLLKVIEYLEVKLNAAAKQDSASTD